MGGDETGGHMKRLGVAACLVALAIGVSGATVLVLWLVGAAWGGSSSRGFCDSLEAWHQAQASFMARTNVPGSRVDSGLQETEQLFEAMAEIPLPEAHSQDQLQARDTLRQLVKAEEEWLSEVSLVNGITKTGSSASSAQRIEALRGEEAKRIEENDLGREASAALQQICGFSPLPLYSQ
jgi:hypothetical protein